LKNDLTPVSRIALLWAGIVIGCSFIATSAKFLAPDLSLPVALEVGRATFRSVGIIESLLALAIIFSMFRSGRYRWQCWVAVVLFSIEWLFVMPALDRLTVLEISGAKSSGSYLHIIVVLMECAKLVLLLWIGFARNISLAKA